MTVSCMQSAGGGGHICPPARMAARRLSVDQWSCSAIIRMMNRGGVSVLYRGSHHLRFERSIQAEALSRIDKSLEHRSGVATANMSSRLMN